MIRIFTLLSFFTLPFLIVSQELPTANDFNASGDARLTSNNCFQLTTATDWSGGSIWYKQAVDLHQPFSMELELMLGCKDEDGADGMVLVFHPEQLQDGRQGEGMGFGGLRPSIGIEIDTWMNDHLGDPYQDHVAVLQNGRSDHYSNLAGPTVIPNIEDCRRHKVLVNWSPGSKTLRMRIDGREVISYRGDIINNIFSGNSAVYWGVTAATGRYNNRQEICFEKLEFTTISAPEFLDRLSTQKLLRGESLILPKIQFASGQSAPDAESLREVDKLLKILKDHPHLALEIAAYTDSSGSEAGNRRISNLRAKALGDYLVRKGIHPKRIYAYGYGELDPIASNATPEGRNANRRVEFKLFRLIP